MLEVISRHAVRGRCHFFKGGTALCLESRRWQRHNSCLRHLLAALQGFFADSTVVVAADILVLDEAVSFSREADLAAGAAANAGVGTLALSSNGGGSGLAGAGDVLRWALKQMAGREAVVADSACVK